MIMKKIFILTIVLSAVIFASCKTEREDVEIRYYLNAINPGIVMDTVTQEIITWKVNYYADGEHHIEEINSTDVKKWSKSIIGKPGDIAYMYVEFNEDITDNMAFSAGIQFERQLFKEARNYQLSQDDTLYTIKLAGTVPYLY